MGSRCTNLWGIHRLGCTSSSVWSLAYPLLQHSSSRARRCAQVNRKLCFIAAGNLTLRLPARLTRVGQGIARFHKIDGSRFFHSYILVYRVATHSHQLKQPMQWLSHESLISQSQVCILVFILRTPNCSISLLCPCSSVTRRWLLKANGRNFEPVPVLQAKVLTYFSPKALLQYTGFSSLTRHLNTDAGIRLGDRPYFQGQRTCVHLVSKIRLEGVQTRRGLPLSSSSYREQPIRVYERVNPPSLTLVLHNSYWCFTNGRATLLDFTHLSVRLFGAERLQVILR